MTLDQLQTQKLGYDAFPDTSITTLNAILNASKMFLAITFQTPMKFRHQNPRTKGAALCRKTIDKLLSLTYINIYVHPQSGCMLLVDTLRQTGVECPATTAIYSGENMQTNINRQTDRNNGCLTAPGNKQGNYTVNRKNTPKCFLI